MEHDTDTITSTSTTALADRALLAARAHRAADPAGWDHRHDDPAHWSRWTRRARVARTIAATLQVPLDWITVADDPHREYRSRDGLVPGDLITVTDSQCELRFIPDFTTPGDGWLLLEECPDCGAPDVPMVPIATLSDLGDWLDPNLDDRYDRVLGFGFFNKDSAHQPGCQWS